MNIQTYGPNITSKAQMNPELEQGSTNKGQFGEVLKQYTAQINQDVKEANAQAEKLVVTGEGNMSETLVAMKQADLSFQLMLSARNKLMDAYREVIRMQV